MAIQFCVAEERGGESIGGKDGEKTMVAAVRLNQGGPRRELRGSSRNVGLDREEWRKGVMRRECEARFCGDCSRLWLVGGGGHWRCCNSGKGEIRWCAN